MSTSSPRWVVVDDTNTDISYDGPWFQDTGSQDNNGNFGPSYRSTLHGTKANASLSYSFSGSQVRVYGTNNIRNDSGVIDPTWECFIDHISIGKTATFPFAENNWLFCEQNVLVDGPHVLTVNATVMNQQTFWFDEIQYIPSASVPLGPEAILVDSKDPALQFGDGWSALGGTANMTTKTDSVFKFDFYGVSLSWYGFIPTELPHTATTASYSVDGQTPVNFLLRGLPENSITIYNQKFFETSTYPAGPHSITVTYGGNGQTTPLTLDYLIVQNGTAPSSGGSSPPSDGSNIGGGKTSRSNNTGAIAGGVVGGVVLILLAIVAFFLLRRRDRRRREQRQNEHYHDPQNIVEPFHYAPVHTAHSGAASYPIPTTQSTAGYGNGSAGNMGHSSMPSYSTTEIQSVMAPSSSALTGPSHMNATIGHTPVAYQPALSKGQREAEEEAAIRRRQQQGRGVPSSPPSSDLSSGASRVVIHEDSGIRMPRPVSVVEIPPQYTIG